MMAWARGPITAVISVHHAPKALGLVFALDTDTIAPARQRDGAVLLVRDGRRVVEHVEPLLAVDLDEHGRALADLVAVPRYLAVREDAVLGARRGLWYPSHSQNQNVSLSIVLLHLRPLAPVGAVR